MTTMNWKIEFLNAYPEHEGETNVVISAGWRVTGVDGEFTSTIYSTATFTLNPDTPFIPFANLTEAIVLDWVWASGVNKDSAEAAIQQYIDNQKKPPVVQPPLPW